MIRFLKLIIGLSHQFTRTMQFIFLQLMKLEENSLHGARKEFLLQYHLFQPMEYKSRKLIEFPDGQFLFSEGAMTFLKAESYCHKRNASKDNNFQDHMM